MKKYWPIPAIAVAAIATIMIYSMASIEKPRVVDGRAVFADGTTISQIKFESSDAEDKHKVAILTIKPGAEKGLSFAVHLNDSSKKIYSNVGDFPLAKYCKGDTTLECSIPISREEFDKSVTMGIAAYVTPGQLIAVTEGQSDWDGHRALFQTLAYHGVY
ncbi:hypothetical protein P5706_21165 [Pseudomonas sp. ChxA]|uniref:hypothetical protein n=1 Tax=Pseudomonas sp. ChxA TaxID=3035473 RepID=UPI0025543B5A|nr:hypothetical protein [Pseudomonas sp. ChxA]MDL2186703.1 hypothetical protein [Pseudomonas sp. ChxA]